MQPELAVIIATRNRCESLRRTLHSLAMAQNRFGATELIVVDNDSSDATASLLRQWSAANTPHHIALRMETPGKSRALNAALRATQASLLAFTDDDTVVDPEWLRAVAEFFTIHHAVAAAMGRTLPPPGTDPELLRDIDRYPGVVPLFDPHEETQELADLFGCNMALRRNVF